MSDAEKIDQLIEKFLNREEFKVKINDGITYGCDERAVFYVFDNSAEKNVFCLRLGIDGIEKHSLRTVQGNETVNYYTILSRLKKALPKDTFLYSDKDASCAFLVDSNGTTITYDYVFKKRLALKNSRRNVL